jgi:hypothetical protein
MKILPRKSGIISVLLFALLNPVTASAHSEKPHRGGLEATEMLVAFDLMPPSSMRHFNPSFFLIRMISYFA